MIEKRPNTYVESKTRLELLDALAWLKSNPIALSAELDRFEFDAGGERYQLEIGHFKNAFEIWQNRLVNCQTLVNWAEAIEMRDDLEILNEQPEIEDALKEIVLNLANPDLFAGNLEELCVNCLEEYQKLHRPVQKQ
jgi:hypothetical protein